MAALGHNQPMKETRVFRARQFALAGKTLVFFIAGTGCTATSLTGQIVVVVTLVTLSSCHLVTLSSQRHAAQLPLTNYFVNSDWLVTLM